VVLTVNTGMLGGTVTVTTNLLDKGDGRAVDQRRTGQLMLTPGRFQLGRGSPDVHVT
jgi:hypothetical protein